MLKESHESPYTLQGLYRMFFIIHYQIKKHLFGIMRTRKKSVVSKEYGNSIFDGFMVSYCFYL